MPSHRQAAGNNGSLRDGRDDALVLGRRVLRAAKEWGIPRAMTMRRKTVKIVANSQVLCYREEEVEEGEDPHVQFRPPPQSHWTRSQSIVSTSGSWSQ
jgi:hypothetical protein